MPKWTYVKAQEEFYQLTDQDKKIYNTLTRSNPIFHLIHDGCYDDLNVLLNFKVTKESNRSYFQFDIAEPLELASNPVLRHSIKGSIFKSSDETNIVYVVSDVNSDAVIGIYIDKSTKINENVILHETSKIDKLFHSISNITVCLTIEKYPDQDEVFVVDPQSQIYQLYKNKEVDVTTFCNLVFFQSRENSDTKIIANNRINLTKLLSKKFKGKKNK